jgi:hypothetical protein
MPCAYPNGQLTTVVFHDGGVPQYGEGGIPAFVGGDAGCSYTYTATLNHEWNKNHPTLPPGIMSVAYTLYNPTLGVIHSQQYDTLFTAPGCLIDTATGSVPGDFTVPGDEYFIAGISSEDLCSLSASYVLNLTAIDGDPICWSVTGIKKNGRKWQYHGPNRVPDRIKIPADVDPNSCIVIEDGFLVPNNKYKLVN